MHTKIRTFVAMVASTLVAVSLVHLVSAQRLVWLPLALMLMVPTFSALTFQTQLVSVL